MIRDIIKIDEELCNGCGQCVPNCHEGALQVIDGKVRLVSELMCDGLGACLGHCPTGALVIEKREATPYDEVATIKEMIPRGKNTVIAHLKHLKEHGEMTYLHQAVTLLDSMGASLPFDIGEVKSAIKHVPNPRVEMLKQQAESHQACGCPGAKPQSFRVDEPALTHQPPTRSQLTHWPVQLHLINPASAFFQGADLLVAADCVAYSLGNFHQDYLRGKTLVIACPKLDDNQEIYLKKITFLADEARVNTITVMIMEVPCCGGLLQMVKTALARASRKVPLKLVVVGIKGAVIKEEWV